MALGLVVVASFCPAATIGPEALWEKAAGVSVCADDGNSVLAYPATAIQSATGKCPVKLSHALTTQLWRRWVSPIERPSPFGVDGVKIICK
jgi:hypothetical protein